MESDSDINTRVTSLRGTKVAQAGVDCLVTIFAPAQSQLGRRYILDRPSITIGRGQENDIVLAHDCVSRQHVRIERRDQHLFSIDLKSTNGTFVNEGSQSVREHKLAPGDRLKVGDTIFKYLSGSDVEMQYHEIIFSMTITDGLTNLANRKQLDAVLADEISRAQRHSRPLSILMLDIDHFKRINDSYGHLAGDAVLRDFSALLQKRMRPNDKLGRYGGEEFCVVLVETNLQSAAVIANELRELVAANTFIADKHKINATISIGAGAFQSGMTTEELYKRADDMLYQAKRTGRNKVCC